MPVDAEFPYNHNVIGKITKSLIQLLLFHVHFGNIKISIT
jgi:hypothetical protein